MHARNEQCDLSSINLDYLMLFIAKQPIFVRPNYIIFFLLNSENYLEILIYNCL